MKIKIYSKKRVWDYLIWALILVLGLYVLFINLNKPVGIIISLVTILISAWALFREYKKEYETLEFSCDKYEIIEQ